MGLLDRRELQRSWRDRQIGRGDHIFESADVAACALGPGCVPLVGTRASCVVCRVDGGASRQQGMSIGEAPVILQRTDLGLHPHLVIGAGEQTGGITGEVMAFRDEGLGVVTAPAHCLRCYWPTGYSPESDTGNRY